MKKDYNKINNDLNELALALIDIEDGDLMLLSDVCDQLTEILSAIPHFESKDNLDRILLGVLNNLLKGGTIDNGSSILSTGIDLLTHFVTYISKTQNTNVKPQSGFLKSVNDFCEKNKEYSQLKNTKSSQKNENKEPSDKISEAHKKQDKDKEEEIKKQTKETNVIRGEAFEIFIVEAHEKIIQAQDLILSLETDLNNKEILNNLFRIFHTIKGECGFLKLSTLGELTHNIENLLDLLRNGEIENDSTIINILLQGIDFSNKLISSIKEGNIQIQENIKIQDFVNIVSEQTEKVKINLGDILKAEGKLSENDVNRILEEQKNQNYSKKFGEIAVDDNLITKEEIEESLTQQKTTEPQEFKNKFQQDSLIKVKSSQINYLVDMIGELLIAENQLDENDKNANQLKKITRQIQEAAMKLRTTEVKTLFLKMKRVIRDLAQKLNKKIETEIIGCDLEIDRNLVETLEEPLIHILRNCAHHGIESEDERHAKGKDVTGKIIINAERTGNSILISIKDDGRGLNREKILTKALDKKIIKPDQVDELSDREIYNLIFNQGFSTTDEVDLVSGRGVGMDIVKAVVIGHRGRVEVLTEPELGTEIRMLFPLSTAIIDGMIVESSHINFIVPVSNIIESVKVEDDMIFKVKDNSKVIKLREEIIPIIFLDKFFDRQHEEENNRVLAVIVENNEKKKFAFMVDNILAKKEIVIKSLGNKFNDLDGISSGTVLQGGKIGFVIDVEQIVNIKGEEVA